MDKISEIYRTVVEYLKRIYLLVKSKTRQFLAARRHGRSAGNETAVQNIRAPGGLAVVHKQRSSRIRRKSKLKVYRLKGYTTVAKINRKRQSERQQRFLRRLLIGIVLILVLILLFYLYNPVKNLDEWYRILGIENLSDLTQSTTSSTTAPGTSGF